MNEKDRAIPRTTLTDFCRALGYEPEEVISIEAASHTVAVTTRPRGVTGIAGVTTTHMLDDAPITDEYLALQQQINEAHCRINSGRGF